MQPYFLPYIGYFSLIDYVDEFIFFDTPQYIYHGWVNRNRILKLNGINYITVPIKKSHRETPINEIQISENIKWREKIFGQLTVYKKAPHYKKVLNLLNEVLDENYFYLSQLNITSTIKICEYLCIETPLKIFSEMNLAIAEVNEPDEWALNITKALNFDTYVNLPGGMNFFDADKYKLNNIKLEFIKNKINPYVQRIGYFEPNLSILDVMMFCDVEEIKNMLKDFEIVKE